jgi:urease accessory protein
VLALSKRDPASLAALRHWVVALVERAADGTHVPTDPGPMAPHRHADGVEGDLHVHDHAH